MLNLILFSLKVFEYELYVVIYTCIANSRVIQTELKLCEQCFNNVTNKKMFKLYDTCWLYSVLQIFVSHKSVTISSWTALGSY